MQIELQELELRYATLRVNDSARAARMRASLAVHGQQSPVVVVAADGGSMPRYVLIDGYVRVNAARLRCRCELQSLQRWFCSHQRLASSMRCACERGPQRLRSLDHA